jgi:diaminopropionate ammonia-lyase
MASFEAARKEISSWPNYRPTPLVSFSGLAQAKNLRAVSYKDEGSRFGLGSFKALGGPYAVFRMLQATIAERTGIVPTSKELRGGGFRDLTKTIRIATATDGNHGRSVAWAASVFHCACVIYVPSTCSVNREVAIARYGAQVVRSTHGYDEAVRQCLQDAEKYGWVVVSDTSWKEYEKRPTIVMQGYTVMVREVLDQLGVAAAPSHVFVQGGVGGLAAAVYAYFCEVFGECKPRLVVVEPSGAACLFASSVAGKRVSLNGKAHTIMAGLEAGDVSLAAWKLLDQGADFFMTIPDSVVPDCMRFLASSPYGDPPVVAGESAIAGLAGLLYVLENDFLRAKVGLDSNSSILLFGTEADTDPDLYSTLVGTPADEVRHRASLLACGILP